MRGRMAKTVLLQNPQDNDSCLVFSCRCGHHATIPARDLHVLPSTSLEAIERAARCTVCGQLGASLLVQANGPVGTVARYVETKEAMDK